MTHDTTGRYWRFDPCGECDEDGCAEGMSVDVTAEIEGLRAERDKARKEQQIMFEHLGGVLAERDAMRDVVDEACHLRDEWREEYQASHADLHAVADAVDAFRAAQQEATDA